MNRNAFYVHALRMRAEGCSAAYGLMYGVPQPLHYLGLSHAIEREYADFCISGVAVVIHHLAMHGELNNTISDDPQFIFNQKRGVSESSGETRLSEDPRADLEFSLIFEIKPVDLSIACDPDNICHRITSSLNHLRLAGGFISPPKEIFHTAQALHAQSLKKLLPGYFMMENNHLNDSWKLLSTQGNATFTEFFLHQISRAVLKEDLKHESFLTPSGKHISPFCKGFRFLQRVEGGLHYARHNGEVVAVEPVFGFCEWTNPLRWDGSAHIFWRYSYQGDYYLCTQSASSISGL